MAQALDPFSRRARLVDIHIAAAQADAVFEGNVLSHYFALSAHAFPGFERLPLDAQGALLSIVYNRSASFGTPGQPSWDREREMRAIRDEVAKIHPSLSAAAAQIRSMKRLWEGKGLDGLLNRRDAETDLAEHAA